jgi:hypothetical protein
MRNDLEMQKVLAALEARKKHVKHEGLLFTGHEPERRSLLAGATGVDIISVSWSTNLEPGENFRSHLQISNNTGAPAHQLSVTTFFGPAALASSYQEMAAWRDTAWPMLGSPWFSVVQHHISLVDLPLMRVPMGIVPGIYMANFVLWAMAPSTQAKIWSRSHVHFTVKV